MLKLGQNNKSPEYSASTTDAELVSAVRRGEKRAFVEIVARHQAMVSGIALGILGDFAASEDAAQEAFLTAWKKFAELREPNKLRGWLGQIARNTALGHRRRQRGHEPLDVAPELADHAPSPDQSAVNEEEALLVRQYLADLPETYRLPLILFYREGQSVRAVAEALDISEDAVKQRLARGREMLRERMSGLIETVLTRTRPTAIFTMTIAVAIGALAAPSAVAGTAFTATTAATASGSSAPVLTIMGTSKTFLAAAALVAVVCVPVGYQISGNRQPVASTNTNAVSKTEAAVRSNQATSGNLEDSAFFAEWKDLHATYGTNAAAMPLLYKAIADLKDPFRTRAFRSALFSEWVRVDGKGGLSFVMSKGPDSLRQQFLQEWIAFDPAAAVDGVLANPDRGEKWTTMVHECLVEMAKKIPSRIPELVAQLPKSASFWDTSVRDAFGILAQNGLASAREAAEKLTGASRDEALSGIANFWGKSDFDATLAWVKGLPENTDRNEIIRAALLARASIDPVAALNSIDLVPSGGRNAYANTTTAARVLEVAARTDFDKTLEWLAARPGRFSREDLGGLSQIVTERLNGDTAGFLSTCAANGTLTALVEPIENAMLNQAGGQRAAVWEWLKEQPENETTKALKQTVLNYAGYQDPDLAMRLSDEIPRTPNGDKQILKMAECLFNGGNGLYRYDKLFEEAPERLRQVITRAAFERLYSDIDNPQKWIERLALLPEDERAKATASLARTWAQQLPEEAAEWMATLPAGEARNGAAAGIATSWAAHDPQGAAQWVATLSSGSERDRGAAALACAIAQQFPMDVWEWALSVTGAEEKSRAAAVAVKVIAHRDPAMARQWIESGPFTNEIRKQLYAALP